jgi:hypothetical protein
MKLDLGNTSTMKLTFDDRPVVSVRVRVTGNTSGTKGR